MVNGVSVPAHEGELLIEALNRHADGAREEARSAGLLFAADGADPELRYVHGAGERCAGAGLCD